MIFAQDQPFTLHAQRFAILVERQQRSVVFHADRVALRRYGHRITESGEDVRTYPDEETLGRRIRIAIAVVFTVVGLIVLR